MKIWLRLLLALLGAVILAGAGVIYWAGRVQQKIAYEQALRFSESIHQMTLAGLTSMMISGTIGLRPLFLEQIEAMPNIRGLHVIRGEAVSRQFGPGYEGEEEMDGFEREAFAAGMRRHRLEEDEASGRAYLRVVIPVRASHDYLGKNCLNCHEVSEGTLLGAVSMEISLDEATASVRLFRREATLAGLAIAVPLALLIWISVSRLVSRRLRDMTQGLRRIAEGDIDRAEPLPVYGADEVDEAVTAFNAVMDKARELISSQRMARIVFDNSLDGIVIADAQGRIQMVNPAFTTTTGYTAEEAIGKTPALLKSGRHDAAFYQEFWHMLQEKGEWRGEIWNRRKDGTIYVEWLSVCAVRDGQGRIEHYVGIFTDITERKAHEQEITFRAYHDALTGLPNRLLFQDRLEHALAHAKRYPERAPAVMFLDLDRFKEINDTFGHEMGDHLLQEFADRLRECVRASDTVARLAGDEFTILLPEMTNEGVAAAIAEKILAAMKKPVRLGEQERVIGTSIGIALYPRDGADAEELMRHADAAMYAAKQSGRGAYRFYRRAVESS